MNVKVSRREKSQTGRVTVNKQPAGKLRPPRERTDLIDAQRAMAAASEYCLFHYPTMVTGGIPRRLSLPDSELWIVPVVLTHPDYGVVGEAGVVAIDARTAKVIVSTPRSEVVAGGQRLREAKRSDLEAAFLQART